MMRRTMIIAVAVAFLAGLPFLPPPAGAQDTAAERQKHEQAAEKKLQDLNRKMDELAAETRKAGGQARDEVNRLYDEFKKKQGRAEKDLEEMRKSTNEAWDKAKVQMNRAIDDLNGVYERAKAGARKHEASPEKAK